MTVSEFEEILKDNKGKEINICNVSFCVENYALVIYINRIGKKEYVSVDSVLNYIEDEKHRTPYFEEFSVYVRDVITYREYLVYADYNYDDENRLSFRRQVVRSFDTETKSSLSGIY